MTAKKLMLFCSVHGASTTRAKCWLSKLVREAWQKHKSQRHGLIMTGTDRVLPGHGAVCAALECDGFCDDQCAHEQLAQRTLKNAIRAAKAAATREANKKKSA